MNVVRGISKPSGRDLFGGEDLIVANSQWTASIIAAKCMKEVSVLYPPVVDGYPKIPISDKEDGFVCIGRITPEKRIERIIEILRLVRARGHDVHLHIIGSAGDPSYGRFIEGICNNEHGWVKFEGLRMGADKRLLLSRHRFAIHACKGEAFGIGVAEMVKAGCITFVPLEGGQAEIVNNSRLTYKDTDDAVNKIDSVLRSRVLQSEVRADLAEASKKYSTENFISQIKGIVYHFLERRNNKG